MSILTPFFNLFKPEKTDPAAIDKINDNMDKIDTEMHKPPLTVNEVEPDPETRNIPITTVPLANDLTSEEAQINTGTYIMRTSGGEASIPQEAAAWLSEVHGYMVKTGYVEPMIHPDVSNTGLTVAIDEETFFSAVSSASGTVTFTYTSSWSPSVATYGITVTGSPQNGDTITVQYVKENLGTITVANPTAFVSTGWNLYNHASGSARVVNYSDEYGFMIDGTYTSLAFAETLSGTQTPITPTNGYFTLPAGATDGYLIVTGGNETDTEIWMTWSDWTDTPNDGVFEPYSQTSIDLSGVMVNFPYGLMRVGNYYDEINLNTSYAYSRIQRLENNETNLENVILSGMPYDLDTGYIYVVRSTPATFQISLDGEYTACDHGMEIFNGTTVPVTASSLYGNSLKNKLERDVLTISQQTLTSSQKTQVQSNLGLTSAVNMAGRMKVESLIIQTAITSSYTTYNTYNSRKFSDYQFVIVVARRGNWILGSTIVLRERFTKTTGTMVMSAWNDDSVEVDVKYTSATSVQAKYITNSTGSTIYFEVLGVSLTA